MIRKVIKIDEDRCSGCGLCVDACQEGAIALVNGKARLVRDDYCDGLGNCLPVCPAGAITLEEQETAGSGAENVAPSPAINEPKRPFFPMGGCPGSRAKRIVRDSAPEEPETEHVESRLMQWPVQMKLVPVQAPYFENANLLVAADCTAYAYGAFHNQFMKNRITLIGCPKLDEGGYAEKLTEILKRNRIKSVTIVRMEVPCCGGLENAVKQALADCGKLIPWSVHIISTDGRILDE